MPEGDSIHRIANRLAPRLVGKTLVRATTQGLERDLVGKRIESVVSHGKHLVIELADPAHPQRAVTVRAHLGMYGRQRSYTRAEGEATIARMSPGKLTLVLVTDEYIEAWIGARTIEVAQRRAPMRGAAVARLGPDLLKDDFDAVVAAERAVTRMAGTRETLADAMLDQKIAAGIGNVYKSEVAFVCGHDPRMPAAALSQAQYEEIFTVARDLLLRNLGTGPRITRDREAGDRPGDDRYFVYGRGGKPCRTCKTNIECYSLGEPPRWTWSCPRCQVRPPEPTGTASGAGS